MRKAFLSYLFGGYDHLEEPNIVTPGWDYICVCEQSMDSAVWRIVDAPARVLLAASCPKRRSGLIKIFHYEAIPDDYDIVICGDACLTINCDLDRFVNEFFPKGTEIAVARHWGRNCLYEEAEAVRQLQFDNPAIVRAQMERYRSEGFPENQGLFANRLLVKLGKSDRVKRFLGMWSEAYMQGSRRDQLSMTYALWRFAQQEQVPLKVEGFDFEEVFRRRNLFSIRPHLLRREWRDATHTTSAGASSNRPCPNV